MQSMVRKTSAEITTDSRAVLDAGFERIYSCIPRGKGWATYPFNTLTLGSHFQPILSVGERRCVAYEGLLQAGNLAGHAMAPDTVFALSASQHEELFLDWLCRALHLRNFANLGQDAARRGMVFLNAYPEAVAEDPHRPRAFAEMMEFYGISPASVVIEILETGAADEAQLVDAAELYRRLGCRIAIDDFGIGYSNFDRLWRLRPDFVKIDRSITAAALRESHAQRVLFNMVKMIHACGAEVIVEGVETRDQALLAVEAGADYVQGYYFARPGPVAMPPALTERMFDGLMGARAVRGMPLTDERLEVHAHALNLAILDLQRGASFARATESFRGLDDVLRVYLATNDDNATDGNGHVRVVLDVIESPRSVDDMARSALGELGRVLAQSLAAPHELQFMSSAALEDRGFVTLSCAFEYDTRMVVLCGDLVQRRAPPHAATSASVVRLHL